jgi:hypothetical protein
MLSRHSSGPTHHPDKIREGTKQQVAGRWAKPNIPGKPISLSIY